MLRLTSLLFLLSLCPVLSAQLTLAVGDEAPRITPTEYLTDRLSKSDLKDKFLVLTLCKSWDQPCFNDVLIQDSLRAAYPNEDVVFLVLFRGKPDYARADIEGKNLDIPLATDLYGKTQVLYGDGETGLLSWPVTYLIDDQNIVRWHDDGDELTVEAIDNFANGREPILDFSDRYVPLSPEDFLFEPMTTHDVADMHIADSVGSFLRVWDQDEFAEGMFMSSYSHSYDMGAVGPATLEDIFQMLFPKKRLVVPGDLMEKEYRVAFIQRHTDRHTEDKLAFGIFEEIGLTASVAPLPATFYELKISDRDKLSEPREVSLRNRLPEGMKDLGNYNDNDLHHFEVRKYSLAGLAKLLNKYSPDRWSFKGNHRKKYNFILDVSSTKALLKSLRKHGLTAVGRAGTVEEITLERKR